MRNNNYVGVTLNRLNVLVLHDLILVGSVNTTSALTLPPLSDMEVGAGHCEGVGVGTVGVGHCGVESLQAQQFVIHLSVTTDQSQHGRIM